MAEIAIGVLWFSMWMITWPALLACLQGGFSSEQNERWFRQDIAFSMGVALLPPMWIAAPFVTGFYEHGFQFGRRR